MAFGIDDVLGGLFGSALNWASSAWANNENQNEATRAREHQESMRRTAHQATVQDLRAAGLNPILSATHGATPGGASAQAAATQSPDAGKSFMEGFSAMQGAKKIESEIALNKEREESERAGQRLANTQADKLSGVDTQKVIEDTKLAIAHVEESKWRQAHLAQQIEQSKGNVKLMAAQEDKVRAEIPHIAAMIRLAKAQTIETLTRSGVNEATAKEILQRVKADLPGWEAKLMEIEAALGDPKISHARTQQIADESPALQYVKLIQSMIPFQNLLVPITRPGAAEKPGPRNTWGSKAPK